MADEKPEAAKSAESPAEGSAPQAATSTEAKPKRAPRRSARERGRGAATAAKRATDSVRNKIASLVWLIAVVCALFLAVGALLVALKANQDNAIVQFVLDGADTLDLGVFSRDEGIFTFDRDRDGVKGALVNWGLAAMAYLIVGRILDRVIRP
ncbi:MAG: hypothetical protein WBQ50_10225 [Nocardioides sp.]